MSSKIGIGIITYNAPEKIRHSAFTVPSFVDEFVIVNDGTPYDSSCYPAFAHIIQHAKNQGISKSKNDVLTYLMEKGCEHIFLMEDDVLIKDPTVFQKYIEASGKTGILHLNFALQGPYNVKHSTQDKTSKGAKLQDRVFDEENSEPAPLYTLDYKNGTAIAFYPACVGAFSYFRRKVIEQAGLFDEQFKNSWEHVEHTYKIIKAGYHPPFGWFADLADSTLYLGNIANCMENSTVAKDPTWKKNSETGAAYFKQLHGYMPGEIPASGKNGLLKSLRSLYSAYRDLKLLIKFPTRGRKDKFFEVLDTYISYLSDKDNYKVVVSCDQDDVTMNAPEVAARFSTYKNLEVHFGNNKSKIEAVNADMEHQTDFDILLLASDDMIPVEKGFDEVIRKDMRTHFPDLDGVLWYNDGYQGNRLNTLSIFGRKYYERFNYIYHPAYKSLWCDAEFMMVANALKKQIYIDRVIIKHDHPASNTKIQEDELYEKNLKLDSVDYQTYQERLKKRFNVSKISMFKDRLGEYLNRRKGVPF